MPRLISSPRARALQPPCRPCRAPLQSIGDVGILGISTGTALVIGAIGVMAYFQLFKKRR